MSKQSREQFLENLRNGLMKTQQERVYEHLYNAHDGCSLQTMRKQMTIPHQSLTSALSRLMDMGVVQQDVEGVFFAAAKSNWDSNALIREDEKYQAWKKRGEQEDWHRRYIREFAKSVR